MRGMSEVAEIVLRVRGGARLTAGFDGWEVELGTGQAVLRRVDATATEVHDALVEVSELGLDLESYHRRAPA